MQSGVAARTETSMLLGIWGLGPAMIGIAQTFQGAGFKHIQALVVVILGTIFPPILLIMAGYDLTIFALLLVTAILILIRLKSRVKA